VRGRAPLANFVCQALPSLQGASRRSFGTFVVAGLPWHGPGGHTERYAGEQRAIPGALIGTAIQRLRVDPQDGRLHVGVVAVSAHLYSPIMADMRPRPKSCFRRICKNSGSFLLSLRLALLPVEERPVGAAPPEVDNDDHTCDRRVSTPQRSERVPLNLHYNQKNRRVCHATCQQAAYRARPRRAQASSLRAAGALFIPNCVQAAWART